MIKERDVVATPSGEKATRQAIVNLFEALKVIHTQSGKAKFEEVIEGLQASILVPDVVVPAAKEIKEESAKEIKEEAVKPQNEQIAKNKNKNR